jgi:hypothetical protein
LIKKGALIGYDGEENIIANENAMILFVRQRDRAGEEAFILGQEIKTIE